MAIYRYPSIRPSWGGRNLATLPSWSLSPPNAKQAGDFLSILPSCRLHVRRFGVTTAGNIPSSSSTQHCCPLSPVGDDDSRHVFTITHRRPLPLFAGDHGRLVTSTYRHCSYPPHSGGVQENMSVPLPQGLQGSLSFNSTLDRLRDSRIRQK